MSEPPPPASASPTEEPASTVEAVPTAEEVDCSQPMPVQTNQFGAPMSNGTGICATVVACADPSEHYEPGTTHMSDGTLMYTQDCNDAFYAQQPAEPEPAPQPDPGTTAGRGYTCDSDIRIWPDGSPVPGYQRCGEMCGEPPTSGDIQGAWFACLESGATEDECRMQRDGY